MFQRHDPTAGRLYAATLALHLFQPKIPLDRLETIQRNTFPKPIDLTEAGEAELRHLRLGFRAPYVHQAAIAIAERQDAFPIDVWVRRALAEWYFPAQKTPPNRVLLEWAQGYFGRYAGYANQRLFHGRRNRQPPQLGNG